MNNRFVNKKTMVISTALLGALSLSGCKDAGEQEKELAVFSSSVADFKDYIQETNEKINNLDVSRKESASELLEILDGMETEFAGFAEYTDRIRDRIPDQYESIPELAKTASEELSDAVSCYHTAYESESFDSNYADAAYTHYEYSMKAVTCIGYILAGEEIPDALQVTVYEPTNDEHILDRWLSGGREEDAGSAVTENETASE